METLVVLVVCLAAAAWAAGAASAARAADWPDQRLDTVAASIAGHPVHVFCENEPAEWTRFGADGDWGFTFDPNADPSTLPSWAKPQTVWLHPWICSTLHDRLNGFPVANNAIALAMHVLTHESVHQRGGVFSNCTAEDRSCEGRTDCMALTLDESVATTFFGYPETVTTSRVVKKKYRRNGRTRWHVYTVTKTRANTQLQDLMLLDHWYHNQLAATNPWYGGGCQ